MLSLVTRHLLLVTALLLALSGCGRSEQASNSVNNLELSAMSYHRNMEKVVNAFIDDYRTQARAVADQLAADAIRAEVGLDGKASAANLQLILNKKMEHYTQIELRVIDMRRKLIEANKDIDHLLQYSAALKSYFTQRTETAQLLNQSSEQLLQLLEQFVKGKKPKTAAEPLPAFVAP
jgi:hypothetical protein